MHGLVKFKLFLKISLVFGVCVCLSSLSKHRDGGGVCRSEGDAGRHLMRKALGVGKLMKIFNFYAGKSFVCFNGKMIGTTNLF